MAILRNQQTPKKENLRLETAIDNEDFVVELEQLDSVEQKKPNMKTPMFSVTQLLKKFNISQNTLKRRMAFLKITPYKDPENKNRVCLSLEQVNAMSGLHEHIKKTGKMAGYQNEQVNDASVLSEDVQNLVIEEECELLDEEVSTVSALSEDIQNIVIIEESDIELLDEQASTMLESHQNIQNASIEENGKSPSSDSGALTNINNVGKLDISESAATTEVNEAEVCLEENAAETVVARAIDEATHMLRTKRALRDKYFNHPELLPLECQQKINQIPIQVKKIASVDQVLAYADALIKKRAKPAV